jgi:hypothetical protein
LSEPLKASLADSSNQKTPAGIECSSMGRKKLQQVVLLFISHCSDRGVELSEYGIYICSCAFAAPDVFVDL